LKEKADDTSFDIEKNRVLQEQWKKSELTDLSGKGEEKHE